jgi:hypothetical protein
LDQIGIQVTPLKLNSVLVTVTSAALAARSLADNPNSQHQIDAQGYPALGEHCVFRGAKEGLDLHIEYLNCDHQHSTQQ